MSGYFGAARQINGLERKREKLSTEEEGKSYVQYAGTP